MCISECGEIESANKIAFDSRFNTKFIENLWAWAMYGISFMCLFAAAAAAARFTYIEFCVNYMLFSSPYK